MFKVVIAEDDRIIRRAISNANWASINATVVGEAAHGQAALELVRKEQPHLLITDINMPFMTGIELAKTLRQEGNQIRMIFLTGYDDFEYLHQALLLKSDDYLLKPVKLEDLLDKASLALSAWQTAHQTKEQLERGLPLLHEKFISDLLFDLEAMTEKDIVASLDQMGIQLNGPAYAVTTVFSLNEETEQLINQLNPYLQKGIHNLMVYQNNEVFIIHSLVEQPDQLDDFRATIRQDYCQGKLFVAASSVFQSLSALKTALVEAKINMEIQKIAELAEKGRHLDALFGIGDGQARMFAELNPDQTSYDKIKSFYDFLSEGTLGLVEAKKIAFNFVVFLIVQLNQLCQEEVVNIYQLSEDMLAVSSMPQLLGLLTPIIQKWEAAFERQQAENQSDSLADRAVQYMKDNFSDPDLSLVKLAEAIHVTSPYLSHLFKNETGLNFTEYLLQLRMEKSKVLLQATSLKTYEVAEAVGYTNPHYFSSSFKKYTGQPPMSYRKNNALLVSANK